MRTSWWDLGEWSGFSGNTLDLRDLVCAFCNERGQFVVEHHAEKKRPNGRKVLNFDTLRCSNCSNFALAFWSASSDYGSGMHDRKVVPWALNVSSYPKHWPDDVGRFWLQAHRNLRDGNLDAACVMARSALQVTLRLHKAEGANLKQEIADLAKKGLLPPIVREWSDNVRELGNDSAHPRPGQVAASPRDAQDIVQFLDFLLEYLLDLPQRINAYRARKSADEPK